MSIPVHLPDIKRRLSLRNVKTSGQTFGYQIGNFNIPKIWTETEGEGVKIAVIDTGAQIDHSDLADVFMPATHNVVDGNSHGTHCAGIIAANNNDIGIVGVAPKSKIIVQKVLGDDGSGTDVGVAEGIYRAIDEGADIISMSLGAPVDMPVVHDAIKAAYAKNIPVICAAGNSGDMGRLDYPGAYPETISVGALDEDNLRAGFSQTGPNLDFMAPGVEILSTVPVNRLEYYSGTSMATPWVAGVVALMIAKHRMHGGKTPINTVEDIREHLKKIAIDIDEIGPDKKTGFGIIDVEKALATLSPDPIPSPGPVGQFKVEYLDLTPEQIAKITVLFDNRKTNVLAISGNVLTYTIPELPEFKVSAINPNPPGSDRDNLQEEWIELQNIGTDVVDMTGWTLCDSSSHVFRFPEHFALSASAYVKIRTGGGSNTASDLYWRSKTPIWNNTGDTIKLYDAENNSILEHAYSGA